MRMKYSPETFHTDWKLALVILKETSQKVSENPEKFDETWLKLLRGHNEDSESKWKRQSKLSCHDEYTTPFREMIRKVPEAAKLVLNKCIVEGPYKDYPDNENYEVAYNYEFVDDFSEDQQQIDELPELNFAYLANRWWKVNGPKLFRKENHPLSIMVRKNRKELFFHPVVLSLINYKWNMYGYWSYTFNIIFYIMFLTFLTSFALVVQNPQEGDCMGVFAKPVVSVMSNLTTMDSNFLENVSSCIYESSVERVFTSVAAGIVLFFALLRLLLEVFQLYAKRLYYFQDWTNWMEIILFTSSILFAAMPNWLCPCVLDWQWQMGVLAVFLAWIDFIVFTSKFKFIGVYVLMFIQIGATFLKLVVLTLLLVVTFGLTFYMIFYDPKFQRSPFNLEFRSMVKTLTLTTGGQNFDNIFRLSFTDKSMDTEELAHIEIAYILWIPFVILMPVLYRNMLTGLAIGDIRNVHKEAEFRLQAITIDQVLTVEEFLHRQCFKCLRNLIKNKFKMKNVIIPHKVKIPKGKLKLWKRILKWLSTFFGVEQHQFNTVEAINKAIRPKRTTKEKVHKIHKKTKKLASELKTMKTALFLEGLQTDETVSLQVLATTTAINDGLEQQNINLDQKWQEVTKMRQEITEIKQAIAEIKQTLFDYKDLLNVTQNGGVNAKSEAVAKSSMV